MLRILIIAPEQIPIPPILGGSVEICIFAIAKQLARKHQVTIISRSHRNYPRHSKINGVTIYRVATGKPMQYLSRVKQFIQNRSFDIVQVDNRPSFIGPLKKLLKHTPVTLFLHSLTFVGPPYISHTTAAQQLAKADIIIANSSSLKQQLTKRFPNAAKKIVKVWLGVDTKRFSPAKISTSKHSFKVLFVGRVIPRKGVPVLLRAIKLSQPALSKPIQVTIVGSSLGGQYLNNMRTLSHQLRLNTKFLGTVPHHQIHKVYKQADVFVCPSQKHEAFGLVNLEAMASGIPVIASNNGGIKEIIRHNKNGLLVHSYHRPVAFSRAIIRLLSNSNARRRMGRQARYDSLNRFSWKASAKRLSHVYTNKILTANY